MKLKKGLFNQIESDNYLKEVERLKKLKEESKENTEIINHSKVRLLGFMIFDFVSFLLRVLFYLLITFISSVGVTALLNSEIREILLKIINLK